MQEEKRPLADEMIHSGKMLVTDIELNASVFRGYKVFLHRDLLVTRRGYRGRSLRRFGILRKADLRGKDE